MTPENADLRFAAARRRASTAPGGIPAQTPAKPGVAPLPSRSNDAHEAARRRADRVARP